MKKIIALIMLVVTLSFPFKYIDAVYAQDKIVSEDVKSYILVDYLSGETISESRSQEKSEIASMVKLMTSLITIEGIENGKFNLDTTFTVSDYAASMEGSEAFLEPGKDYKLDDLLKSVIIASANDSSVVIAENIAGSESNFVSMMNKRAKELGMSNTLYANATGLPSTLQYSTAQDISILLREVVKHDTYYKYSKIWMDELVHYDGRKTELVNTNRLIRQYTGCDIGKTGFTDEAGYCLASSAKRNNMRLVSVVIGAKTAKERFSASEKLLNYGFSNYENKKVADSQECIKNDVKVKGAKQNTINLSYEKDFYYLNKKGEDSMVSIKTELPQSITSPVKKGDRVGKAYIVKDGVIIETINIISLDDITNISLKDAIDTIFDNWKF